MCAARMQAVLEKTRKACGKRERNRRNPHLCFEIDHVFLPHHSSPFVQSFFAMADAGIQLFAAKRRRSLHSREGGAPTSLKTHAESDAAYAATATAGGKGRPVADFATLGVAPWLRAACSAMGIRSPTPVQANCIPPALAGRDVIGCAQTGSGKTAAFALPILQPLAVDPYGIFAVVLTPARELAFQIAEQFSALGAPINVRVAVVVGGLDIVTQALELSKLPHVVVATPGRLAHHLTAGAEPRPALSAAAWLVLDEVDRLLDPSMAADMRVILRAVHGGSGQLGAGGGAAAAAPAPLPLRCRTAPLQTLLFSATMQFRPGELDALHLAPGPFTYGAALGSRPALGSGAGGRGDGGSGDSGGSSSAPLPALTLVPAAAAAAEGSGGGGTGLVPLPQLRHEYVFMPAAVKHAYLLVLLLRAMGPDVSIDAALAAAARNRHGKKQQQLKGAPRGSLPPRARTAAHSSGKQRQGGPPRRRVIGARSSLRTAADEHTALSGRHAAAAQVTAASVVAAAMDSLAARAKAASAGAAAGAASGTATAPRDVGRDSSSNAIGSGRGALDNDDDDDDDDDDDRSGRYSGSESGSESSSADSEGGARQRGQLQRRGTAAAAASRRRQHPLPRKHTGDTDSDEEEEEEESVGSGGDEEAEAAAAGDDSSSSSGGGEEEQEEDPLPPARSAILFLSTCRSAALVSELLLELGIPNVPLHSAMPQAVRLASLAKFRASLVRVLVATDVASRGLDIPTVSRDGVWRCDGGAGVGHCPHPPPPPSPTLSSGRPCRER
jgi:hypothetical protein